MINYNSSVCMQCILLFVKYMFYKELKMAINQK